MKLIIVESPTKCETIKKYLGDEYEVVASYGHIRDLATSGKGGLGVDVDHDFKPTYIVNPDKYKVVANLQKKAKNAEKVFLATDPDREGEAISWHLAEVLKLDVDTSPRLEFHEITKKAITRAIENPRTIDMNLVSSQETRRIIDRIMGFKLSGLMKRKIGSLSAGRVQSVTLKLISEREKEIKAFVPEEYWTIHGHFKNVLFNLDSYLGRKVSLKNEEETLEMMSKLPSVYLIQEVKRTPRYQEAALPFRTSVLQQAAFSKNHFSPQRTQMYAQRLFEMGLITYMRTDGVSLSSDFINQGREFIIKNYGSNYLADENKLKSLENKESSTSAHEAIRPTSLDLTPTKAKDVLNGDKNLLALYRLIYNRSLAALMAPKKEEVLNVSASKEGFLFTYTGSKLVFDGYSKVYQIDEDKEDNQEIDVNEGDEITFDSIEKKQHFTKGPAHFNEAKVVKTMEELGIGRPSTYASTIETLFARNYIVKDKDNLIPTEQGDSTVEALNKFFAPFMDVHYTANMESELDELAEGKESRNKILHSFYDSFEPLLENATKNMEKEEPKPTGELCPICGKPLVYRRSKYGTFEACSGYPVCNYVKKEVKEEIVSDKLCPKCGRPLVKRKSKRGEFWACSGYPTCSYIDGQDEEKEASYTLTSIPCPKCGKMLIRRKGKYGKADYYTCSGFPKCRYIESIKEDK